jgi:hypothetical protein
MHAAGFLIPLFALTMPIAPTIGSGIAADGCVADTGSARIVRVKGRVIDDQAVPLENALVEMSSPATGRTVSVRTNAHGEYALRTSERSAQFHVLVRRIGFRPVRFAVAIPTCDAPVAGNVQMLPIAPVFVL